MEPALKPQISPVVTEDTSELRKLSEEMSDLQSVRYLSRGLMTSFWGTIGLGVTIKLFIDSKGFPWWGYAAAMVDSVVWVVAAVSFYRRRRYVREERVVFARLRKEHERLGLSPPGQLT
jgi:hypothetical protein